VGDTGKEQDQGGEKGNRRRRKGKQTPLKNLLGPFTILQFFRWGPVKIEHVDFLFLKSKGGINGVFFRKGGLRKIFPSNHFSHISKELFHLIHWMFPAGMRTQSLK